MDKMDMYIFRPTSKKIIVCVGSEKNIDKLKKFEHHKDVEHIVEFLIENGIYCGVSCENEEDTVISKEALRKLADNELLLSAELVFEAFVLSDKEKTYSNLEFLQITKEEADDIFANSWWLHKFEV